VSFYPFLRSRSDGAGAGHVTGRAGVDHAAARLDSLRLLADATDGLAVLKRTAIDEALPRIVADACLRTIWSPTARPTPNWTDGSGPSARE
jgi:hypothetical protein